MNLIVTEKHDAAQQIARLLSTVGNPCLLYTSDAADDIALV